MSRRGLVLSLAVIASTLAAPLVAHAGPRAVIELFTSQGCSSCPPADKLAGEFAQDPSLVVFTLAIDYWDYLGWKDTLAIAGHTNRQRAYAKARGDREVYTPQVVVNGTAHVIGSERGAIEETIGKTSKLAGTMSLPVKLAVSAESIAVSLPAAKNGEAKDAKGEIWLCPVSKSVQVTIQKGENSGHTVTYHNVVRRWIRLGEWTGVARTLTVPTREFGGEGIDAVGVVVQAGTKEKPGAMLGAAIASLQ
jgi:hypothetical protein